MIPPTNTLLGSSISRLVPKGYAKNLAKDVFRAVHPAAENVDVARMMGRWFQVCFRSLREILQFNLHYFHLIQILGDQQSSCYPRSVYSIALYVFLFHLPTNKIFLGDHVLFINKANITIN